MTTHTQTPDDQAAVQALAEAMADIVNDSRNPVYASDYFIDDAETALQAIRANPELAGFRTVTVSELFATTLNDPDLPCDTANMLAPVLIIPDPDPPAEPELPSVPDDLVKQMARSLVDFGTGNTTFQEVMDIVKGAYIRGYAAAEAGRKDGR